jgi:curved DNA-binding protein CbpA
MAHLYEVLGIGSNAGTAEIKIAFHRLAKTYHPDLHAGDVRFEERFKAINHAYGILGKIESRTLYDEECALESTRKRERMGTAAVVMAASFMLTVGVGLLIAGWLRIEGIL